MADLIAELAGFRDELSGYERSASRLDRKDRVTAVKSEIKRVEATIRVEAEKLIAQAENHEAAGQDVLAAQCRVEAKRLVREGRLDAPDDASDSAPRETAVVPKGKRAGA